MIETNIEKLRIIVVFRSDLPEMTRAKGEVQFGHAVASVMFSAMQVEPSVVEQYMSENQIKLNMEVDGLEALLKIQEKATKRGVNHFVVTDAAHTVFEKPTITAIGLGPMSKTDGNALTRDARMRL
jgi:peptidyl-tRNA hydrolase